MVAHAPLRFEPAGAGSRYITRGLKFASSLTGDHMDLLSKDQAMRLTFANASPSVKLEPGDRMRSISNVIHGNDRTKWRTVANYSSLHARDLYPGVDLIYYGNQGDLEYDLIVKPGADPRKVRLQISGVTPTLDAEGNLNAAFIQKRPVAYQVSADGTRTLVAGRYHRNSDGTFGFALGRYDKSRDLVIDPTLTFSTFIYGSSQDTIRAIGHDAVGYVYVAGITLSTDFEIDPNTMQVPGGPQGAAYVGGYDCFLAVIDGNITNGNNPVVFATYLGGTGDDILNDMFVAPNGLVYLTGYTKSTDFPSGTFTGYQTTLLGNSDAFVVVYDVSQGVGSQIVYSSYMGGVLGTAGNGVTADSQGNVYIAGTTNSVDFPTRNPFQPGLLDGADAFVSGFNPRQSGDASLIYSTFLGGTSFEQGYGITAAPDGTLWVVGQTFSQDFPVAGNVFQGNTNGNTDAFVVHLDPTQGAQGLLYGTYLGGTGLDEARRVVMDAKGRVVVAGYTLSGDFPLTPDAMQSSYKGAGDVFVSVLNPVATGSAATLVYSTYYGGTGSDLVTGLAKDAKGAVYLSGYTGSFDLPVTGNAFNNIAGRQTGQDGFVLKLDPSVAGIGGMVYSSYVASTGSQISYGIDVDAKGNIWVAGYTTTGIFDALGGAAKTTASGNIDGFVMGFSLP